MIENSPKKRDGLTTVDLGPTVKTEWVQWCQERDLVPGRAIKALVEKAMTEGVDLAPSDHASKVVVVKVLQSADTRLKVGREIYFTVSENEAIQKVAQAQGLGFHEFVIAAVRAALANAPTYGQAELEALTQSNGLLVQIAADLATLGRRAGEAGQANEFGTLEAHVKAHVEQASKTMAQGARRWSLKV